MAFFAGAYYLPIYYQVLGSSATGAGVRMLPFSLGASLFSAISGIVVTKTGRYRPIIWLALAVFTLGYGLMYLLDSKSNVAMKVLYPFVASAGLGCLFLAPLVALQAAMPIKDMATSTSTFGFLRTMGGTVGISIGQVVFTNTARKKLAKIPNLNFGTSASNLSENLRRLHDIPDPVQRAAVIQAFSKSISTIFLVHAPIIGFCFVLSLLLRHYTLQRQVVFGDGAPATSGAESADQPNIPYEAGGEQHNDEKNSDDATERV